MIWITGTIIAVCSITMLIWVTRPTDNDVREIMRIRREEKRYCSISVGGTISPKGGVR